MKLYLAGVPYDSVGARLRLRNAVKRGVFNFLFSYGSQQTRSGVQDLVAGRTDAVCVGCGKLMVHVGEDLVCPDLAAQYESTMDKNPEPPVR